MNRCTDATGRVTARRERLPLRSVSEPELGLCQGGNTAVEAARGAFDSPDDISLTWMTWIL